MPSSDVQFDVIVIGGGHNGLVAAGLLAKAGRRVVVLEADEAMGGAARPHEIAPGVTAPGPAHILNLLHPDVVTELDLPGHGLDFAVTEMPTIALSAEADPLVLRGAFGEMLDGDVTERDRDNWADMRARLLRYAGVLKVFLTELPPKLGPGPLGEKAALGKLGLAIRRLGRDDMREFLRLLLMNVADVLEEELADDRLKGSIAFDAVLGTHAGPRSPSSMLALYYRLAGEIEGQAGALALPRGGMGQVIAALVEAATGNSVILRPGCAVSRIDAEGGRVSGVTLESGETVRAPLIVSAVNPRTTFIDLVGARHLETGLVRRLNTIRMRGTTARLNLVLSALPEFAGVDPRDLNGRLVIAPSVDAVERAFNPVKYRRFSAEPVMEMVLPTVADPSLAGDGRHVLSATVQYAPHDLEGGWKKGRKAFETAILDRIAMHAPGIRDLIVARELLTPADIAQRYRMPGGEWHHGELAVDQMFMLRPTHMAARYRTAIDGLWLAGAGSHPGGGVSGVPGLNAARAILSAKEGA